MSHSARVAKVQKATMKPEENTTVEKPSEKTVTEIAEALTVDSGVKAALKPLALTVKSDKKLQAEAKAFAVAVAKVGSSELLNTWNKVIRFVQYVFSVADVTPDTVGKDRYQYAVNRVCVQAVADELGVTKPDSLREPPTETQVASRLASKRDGAKLRQLVEALAKFLPKDWQAKHGFKTADDAKEEKKEAIEAK